MGWTFEDTTMMSSQILFCAEECERQEVGPREVSHMFGALQLVEERGYRRSHLSAQFIKDLGGRIEPEKNKHGWRIVQVFFVETSGSQVPLPGCEALPPEHIDRKINDLVHAEYYDRVTPDEFYFEFQRIHPFLDGNGRVGAILWNYLKGTLESPETPPDFFKSEPEPVHVW